jgi:hypothetical protein
MFHQLLFIILLNISKCPKINLVKKKGERMPRLKSAKPQKESCSQGVEGTMSGMTALSVLREVFVSGWAIIAPINPQVLK